VRDLWFDYFDTAYEGIECAWDATILALWWLCALPVIVTLFVCLYTVLFPFWLIGKCKNERL
jgi:hypothetical protein